MVPDVVENQVVAFRALGEILFGVIDDVIGADRSDHVYVSRAAHAGDVCPERLGDLHGERTHASRRAIDQDLLPRLNLSLVAETLQRRDCGDPHGSRLLERQVGRLQRHCSILSNQHVLRERTGPPAENLITWFEPIDVPADRFDRTCKVDAQSCDLWFTQPGPQAHEVRRASHVMPVEWIDGSRANPDQNLVVSWSRLFDVLDLENVRRTIVAIDDRFHLVALSSGLAIGACVARRPVGDEQRQQGERNRACAPPCDAP